MILTNTAIALIIVTIGLLLVGVFIAASYMAVKAWENNAVYSARAGSTLKIQGQTFKILPIANYRALVNLGDEHNAWRWDTIGGKQR